MERASPSSLRFLSMINNQIPISVPPYLSVCSGLCSSKSFVLFCVYVNVVQALFVMLLSR